MATPVRLTREKSVVMHGLAADPKKAESVKDLFKLCDKNGDGEVTKEELCQVFKELKLQATEEELENLFEDLDVDNSGTVNLDEFLAGIERFQSVMAPKGKAKRKAAPSKEKQVDNIVAQIAEMESQNNAMRGYILETVSRGIRMALKEAQTGNVQAAVAILKVLDVPLIHDTEEYMGGDILTEEDIKNYKKTKAIIKKMLSSAI